VLDDLGVVAIRRAAMTSLLQKFVRISDISKGILVRSTVPRAFWTFSRRSEVLDLIGRSAEI
jgi:hypothetical protein